MIQSFVFWNFAFTKIMKYITEINLTIVTLLYVQLKLRTDQSLKLIFKMKCRQIISFRIISKVTVNRKKMIWLQQNSATDVFLANFWGFDKFFWMVVFKTIFKVVIRSLILPQLVSFWCLLQYLDKFSSNLCRSSHPKRLYKKGKLSQVFLKFPQNSQENIYAGVSSPIKLQTWDLRLHWIQNLSNLQVLSCEFWKIFKDVYFANLCEALPLKSNIFTFRKILGSYYKQNR